MDFTFNERTKLIDFIITHETLDENYLLSNKDSSSDMYSYAYVKLIEDYYNSLKKYHPLLHTIHTTEYAPLACMIFHEIDKNTLHSVDNFINELKKLSEDDLKNILTKNLLEDETATADNIFEKITNLDAPNDSKFVLLFAYNEPKKYLTNLVKLFEEVYPIFSAYYERCKKVFSKLIEDTIKHYSQTPFSALSDFFGSEKLDTLYKEYHGDNLVNIDNYDAEFIPLIMAQHRVVAHMKTPLIAVGLQVFGLTERMKEADKIRKDLLKALSDDTRFEILRMINFGFNTNKKLSEFFKISPPAISYQTTILKKANLVEIADDGTVSLKKETISDGFDKIKSLFDITGEA